MQLVTVTQRQFIKLNTDEQRKVLKGLGTTHRIAPPTKRIKVALTPKLSQSRACSPIVEMIQDSEIGSRHFEESDRRW